MKTRFFGGLLLLSSCILVKSQMSIMPWTPLFQGIDFARGTNIPDGSTPIPRIQVVSVARVDLTAPGVTLFSTPQFTNYLEDVRETAALSVTNFIAAYGLQLAVNANWYTSNIDPPDGSPTEVQGLAISRGVV